MALVRKELSQQIEPKHFDVAFSSTAGSGGSGVLYLSAIPQGTTDITRVGDRLTLRSLEARWDTVYADATNIVRFILFQWIGDAVTDVPAITDILESVPYVFSAYNWDIRHKVRILHDETVSLADVGPKVHQGKVKIGLANTQQRFLAASTNIEAGGLFALFVSDSAAIAHPVYNLYTRVAYNDA